MQRFVLKSRIPSIVQQYINSYYGNGGYHGGDGNMFRQNSSKIRVYYAKKYFKSIDTSSNEALIERMLTAIPQVCINADKHIELQDGRKVSSYNEALSYYPDLLTYDERILARRKIIISPTQLLAYGGYHSDVQILPSQQQQTILVLSCAGAQLDVPQLDFKLFMNNNKLNESAMLQSLIDDVTLWLNSLQQYMTNVCPILPAAHLRICAVGGGWFAVNKYGDFRKQVAALILDAFVSVLSKTLASSITRIEHCEFTYFDNCNPDAIKRLHQLFRCSFTSNDICLPLAPHQSHRTLVITNPSDTFAILTNELGYDSVEAEIGNNTTLRLEQSYHFNTHLLDHVNYVSI